MTDIVSFKPKRSDDLAVDAVFSAAIYTVDTTIDIQTTSLTVVRIGDKIVGFPHPTSGSRRRSAEFRSVRG